MTRAGAILVGSENAAIGMADAMAVLRAGGTALDAVGAGIRRVERNPEDHTVGYSGIPNLLGEVELDASVIEGRHLAAGAVGALHGHQDALALARAVMERLPHVLVVGAGADRLAEEVGLPPVDLLTEEARQIWAQRLRGEDPGQLEPSYLERVRALASDLAPEPGEGDQRQGTVNLIARDREGHLVSAVSTSGFPLKYPGRLGDSPVIGAGNYADDRWGAAACTGFGELSLRACTAHSVVTFLRFGMSLEEALRQAVHDLDHLQTPGEMNIVAIDREGRPGGASTLAGKTYARMTEEMDEPQLEPRLLVLPESR